MLKQLEEALISFRSAFVSGTGCPQLNLSFALQLQRKGSSMDFFNFYLDILALQPPASLADPFGIGGGGGELSLSELQSKSAELSFLHEFIFFFCTDVFPELQAELQDQLTQ